MVRGASLDALWYLGIIPTVGIRCIVLALLCTPPATWALRNYSSLKWISLLFLVLVAWVLLVKEMPGGRLAIFGALLLSFFGLILIGFLCRR
jgi:hypothetical protein